ncbi:LysR family transcriptional regulator, partial [Bordetella pertussis]|uniref:LysR family transcriptional regulator n=1 Tax=Bordetella pertussis TaxID=520 RepID=UPI000A679856
MLDPVLLRSFVTVVDTGNFTRASEHLHLTQSTVSQHVIRLEENLGCRLLDRGQRHVLPTEEGERLLGYARSILRLADEARESVAAAQGNAVLRRRTGPSRCAGWPRATAPPCPPARRCRWR